MIVGCESPSLGRMDGITHEDEIGVKSERVEFTIATPMSVDTEYHRDVCDTPNEPSLATTQMEIIRIQNQIQCEEKLHSQTSSELLQAINAFREISHSQWSAFLDYTERFVLPMSEEQLIEYGRDTRDSKSSGLISILRLLNCYGVILSMKVVNVNVRKILSPSTLVQRLKNIPDSYHHRRTLFEAMSPHFYLMDNFEMTLRAQRPRVPFIDCAVAMFNWLDIFSKWASVDRESVIHQLRHQVLHLRNSIKHLVQPDARKSKEKNGLYAEGSTDTNTKTTASEASDEKETKKLQSQQRATPGIQKSIPKRSPATGASEPGRRLLGSTASTNNRIAETLRGRASKPSPELLTSVRPQRRNSQSPLMQRPERTITVDKKEQRQPHQGVMGTTKRVNSQVFSNTYRHSPRQERPSAAPRPRSVSVRRDQPILETVAAGKRALGRTKSARSNIRSSATEPVTMLERSVPSTRRESTLDGQADRIRPIQENGSEYPQHHKRLYTSDKRGERSPQMNASRQPQPHDYLKKNVDPLRRSGQSPGPTELRRSLLSPGPTDPLRRSILSPGPTDPVRRSGQSPGPTDPVRRSGQSPGPMNDYRFQGSETPQSQPDTRSPVHRDPPIVPITLTGDTRQHGFETPILEDVGSQNTRDPLTVPKSLTSTDRRPLIPEQGLEQEEDHTYETEGRPDDIRTPPREQLTVPSQEGRRAVPPPASLFTPSNNQPSGCSHDSLLERALNENIDQRRGSHLSKELSERTTFFKFSMDGERDTHMVKENVTGSSLCLPGGQWPPEGCRQPRNSVQELMVEETKNNIILDDTSTTAPSTGTSKLNISTTPSTSSGNNNRRRSASVGHSLRSKEEVTGPASNMSKGSMISNSSAAAASQPQAAVQISLKQRVSMQTASAGVLRLSNNSIRSSRTLGTSVSAYPLDRTARSARDRGSVSTQDQGPKENTPFGKTVKKKETPVTVARSNTEREFRPSARRSVQTQEKGPATTKSDVITRTNVPKKKYITKYSLASKLGPAGMHILNVPVGLGTRHRDSDDGGFEPCIPNPIRRELSDLERKDIYYALDAAWKYIWPWTKYPKMI